MLLLTESAVLQCVHGARLALRSTQPFVTIGGQAIMTLPMPAGATVTGCPNNNPQAGLKPCLVAAPPLSGTSLLVRIARRPVCLDTSNGLTDGTPIANYRVTQAGQRLVSSAA